MDNKKIAIAARNFSKTFYTREKQPGSFKQYLQSLIRNRGPKYKEIKALQHINFEVEQGECFGIIGGNGSGKSTLLKLIMGSYLPDKESELIVNGKVMRLSLGMGFDPLLTLSLIHI